MKKMVLYIILLWIGNGYSQISLHSKFSGIAKPNGKGELEVQINKNNINSFAKYQIEVPNGVLISDIDVKGGNFLMEKNKAKVVWVNLPTENTFIIKLKVSFSDDVSFPATLYQKFYYLENSVKKEIQAEPLSISASETTITQINKNENMGNQTANISTDISSNKNLSGVSNNQAPKQNVATTIYQDKDKTNDAPIKKEETKSKYDNSSTISTTHQYTYKIQIAASSVRPNESAYSNIGKVEIIKHNAMYKVMIDKAFQSKEEALKYREQVIQAGYSGAFLVKYLNGQRVN